MASTLYWPHACRLAMSLTARGCEVDAWCPKGHPHEVTRAVVRRYRCRPFAPLTSLERAIKRSAPDFVIACDDEAVHYLEALHRKAADADPDNPLVSLISRSLGDPKRSTSACDRGTLMRIAASLGLRIPFSADLKNPAAVDRWSTEGGYPAVFKAYPSWGGRGVIRVDDPAAGRAAFTHLTRSTWGQSVSEHLLRGDSAPLQRMLEGKRPRVLAQRLIEGRPANRAVACWKGEVLAGISVQALETQGDTGPASVIQMIDPDDMRVAARTLVHFLGLSGFCGLDFIIEKNSGDAYLIEMNPRATPICHLNLGPDWDLIGSMLSRLLRDCPRVTCEPPRAAETGAQIIALFPGEWLRNPYSRYLHEAHHDVPWSEPALIDDCTALSWDARSPLVNRPGF
jgi:hypothetical protein